MNEIMKNEAKAKSNFLESLKESKSKRIIAISVIAGIILLTLGMIWVYGYNYAKNAAESQIEELRTRISDLENSPIVLEPVTPEIVQSIISSKTNTISELATAEYVFTNAAKFTDTKHIAAIFDWMTEKSFIQRWDGVIKAGVKLDNMSVDVSDTVITITLSPAEILSYEIDYDSIEVLDEKNNVFNPISVEDKNSFDKETKDSMVERAKENGLLEKAQKNAEDIITALITANLDNAQDYTVKFVYANS